MDFLGIYLKKVNKIYQEEEPVQEPVEKENFDTRKTTYLTWLKKLNAKFKPYAAFTLMIEKTEDDKEGVYLTLKPANSEIDRYFYHLSMEPNLTEETFKKIIKMANNQLSERAASTD